jgi:periplasmic protein TonB
VNRRGLLTALALAAALGCGPRDDGTIRLTGGATVASTAPPDQPPVAVNPVSPVEYPAALREQGIEGRVLLRLYADTQGAVVAESTKVAESSGYPALDSAAMAGAPKLRFSPALRGGRPVAGAFLQPVHFRNPRTRSTPQ